MTTPKTPKPPASAKAMARRLTPKKTERIAKRLTRVLDINRRIGKLCSRRDNLLALAQTAGLDLNQPIPLPPDGTLFYLRVPEGKYVHFPKIELAKVPRIDRTKGGSAAPSGDKNGVAAGVTPADGSAS